MRKTEWLDDTEDAAWRGLRRVNLVALAEISKDLQRDSHLSDADYEVLTGLSESSGNRSRFSDLAKRTRWSTSRLSHHLDRMQTRELVVRLQVAGDGRGSDVELTALGRVAIENAAPLHVGSVRRHVFDHLSDEQTAQLAAITRSILSHHELQN